VNTPIIGAAVPAGIEAGQPDAILQSVDVDQGCNRRDALG
jgi:hypothetical protein